MKLIAEEATSVKMLAEEVDNKKNYYIEGIFLQGDLVNGNGRVYPMSVLDEAVQKYMPLVEQNRALGELNHPTTPRIDYERAVIKTVSLVKEGSNYIGKAKLLSTPLGTLCKGLVDDGVQLAVSSRGLGSIKESKGQNVVQSGFTLAAAADVVYDPSAPDAFVNGIVEGTEWVYSEGGVLVEQKIEEIQSIAKKSAKEISENKSKLLSDFILLLK